jgi:hypothetical protein
MSEYKHPLTDENEKVICQECGMSYNIITPRHLQKHDITLNDYRNKYPKAPISSKEFTAKSQYGKQTNLFITDKEFVKEELEKIEKEIVLEKDSDDDFPDEVAPTIDEKLNYNEIYSEKDQKKTNYFSLTKDIVLDHLKMFLPHVTKDYIIQIITMDKRIIYECISDFADPVLKVNVEFPKAFWHNSMGFEDTCRNLKLREDGWKVIVVDSNHPTFEQIQEALD